MNGLKVVLQQWPDMDAESQAIVSCPSRRPSWYAGIRTQKDTRRLSVQLAVSLEPVYVSKCRG